MDIENTPIGTDFREHIAKELRRCDAVLAIIGPHWNELNEQNQPRIFDSEDWVRVEIETALRTKLPIIPVLIDRAPLPKPADLPDSLHDFTFRQAVDIDSGRNFGIDISRLIHAIEEYTGRAVKNRRYVPAGVVAVSLLVVGVVVVVRQLDREGEVSKLEKRQAAVQACNATFRLDCAKAGGVFAADEALSHLNTCKNDYQIFVSDDPSLLWTDIWTTSVYSFAPGGGGPGGGLDDDVLKVGGWGDWYFSLIQFKLPRLQHRPQFSAVALYSKQSEGASVPLALDRIIQPWSFPKGDRLWWKDRPGHRAVTTDSLPAPRKEEWYIIEITTLVQEWADGKSDNYGIQIRPTHQFGSFVFFVSSDATDKSKIPRLIFCQ
jgi:hypothetical protein